MHQLLKLVLVFASLLLAVPAAGVTITSSSESVPYPGVRIVEGRTSSPATDFYVAYFTLCTDQIHVTASSYGGLRTTGAWANAAGVEVAVNGDFYTTSGTDHVYGDAVGAQGRWPAARTGRDPAYAGDWYYQRYGWIGFGDDMVEFSNSEHVKNNDLSDSGWQPDAWTTDLPTGITSLISGFPQLVIDGAPVTCSSPTASSCFPDRTDMRARHPRTAMGLNRERTQFMLVVVDGRSGSSAGMYGSELADLMDQLGAHTAFNLDGGGSSQMWVRGRGTINAPSDGSPRAVLNSWGIYAGDGNGLPRLPGSCDLDDAGLHAQLWPMSSTETDLDGDGRADACARRPDGVLECALASDDGFAAGFETDAFQSTSGWNDVTNSSTLRLGDIDGDGRTDLCARANGGLRCRRSTGSAFSGGVAGPAWSDDLGFDRPQYYTTLRLADITGDGADDACIRTSDGIVCHAAESTGFGPAIAGPALRDASGWADPANYGTIRFGDIDGDGDDDLCARANAGMRCWKSDGAGFGPSIAGPEWSDGAGWRHFRSWNTIRLDDIDGDGMADLCGRAPEGIRCALSTGDGFAAEIVGPSLDDGSGWADPDNAMTIQLGDVTGDGALDLCARANAGMRCWPWDGSTFSGPAIQGRFADDAGWNAVRHYRSIQLADIDGDGLADLCARANAGLVCFRSTGDAFEDEAVLGPAWSDASGFGSRAHYSSVLLTGPRRARPTPPPPMDDPVLDDPVLDDPLDAARDTGTTDAASAGDGAGENDGDAAIIGGPSAPDRATRADAAGGDAALPELSPDAQVDGACACSTQRSAPPPWGAALVVLVGLIGSVGLRRRRDAPS